jgi:AraC-like DNA-binding protein
MHEQQEMLCELWPEEQMQKKSHSRLYSLEPIGVGSPMVESLTSYIVRLAEAHSVYPRALILHEIAPLLKLLSLNQNGHIVYDHVTIYLKKSVVLNGRTTQTSDIVQALEQLTLRYDLHFLTMLPWQFVLSSQKLLRRTRAWCPICYQEWLNKNQTLYEPLLWSLEVINVCHQHRLRLQMRCPNSKCNQVQLPLSQHAQSGYCSRCNSWLGSLPQCEAGESLVFEDNEWKWQQWIVHAVGDLLSAAPALSDAPQRERILSTIDMYAEKLTGGQREKLIHLLECNSSTIRGWFYKDLTPQLSHLLQFCFRLGASPIQLLLGNIEEAAVEKHTLVDRPKGRYQKFDEERIRQMLEAILRSEDTSPSMREVARQLGHDQSQIYRRFPELCRAISAKHAASPIFTRQVQITLGVTRSITIEQQFRRFDRERVLQALEAALQISEGDPPSMAAVAKSLGYWQGEVRKRFPELCRAISKRYKEAQAAKKVQRVQLLCSEVRGVVFTIHEQRRYPSKRQVAKYLKNPTALRETVVESAWKEAVQELGWK